MRLLLVEDDSMIGESIEEELREQGYAVDWIRDGTSADLALQTQDYDLVLLDLGLPRKQGLNVLADFRRRGGQAPVLIITARDAIDDRVTGLDAGSDDYLVKPFDLNELNARVRALLRRRIGRANPEIRHNQLVLNPATHEVHYGHQLLNLSAREFAVLHALMDPPGEVVSRSQLEERLYGWGEEVESNTLDVFIHHLRKKLGADLIQTVRGVGFKLVDKR
jgi:two-component system OmpR family response regulator/two-component system response regulator QseB